MSFSGTIFYFFGVDYYVVPSNGAIWSIVVLGCIFFLAYFYFLIILNIYSPMRDRYLKFQDISKYSISHNGLVNYALVAISVCCFLYFLMHIKSFPYWSFWLGSGGESSRPDVVGGVPFYWTFSVFLNSFTIPFSVYLFVNSIKSSRSIYTTCAFLFLLVFWGFMMGSKSGLISIAFFIMFFAYRPSIIKATLFVLFFLVFYIFVKYLYVRPDTGLFGLYSFSGLLESIFRRLVMVNISSMGVVYDRLISHGFSVPSEFTHIKQYVFYVIYGYLPGGAPVPFVMDIFYKAKSFELTVFLLFLYAFFAFCLRFYFMSTFRNEFLFLASYLNFYGAIVFVTGGFFDFFARYVFPVTVLILISAVSRILKR